MPAKFTFKPGPPTDAYKFWKDKVPMSKAAFNALAEEDRVRAFVVSGMAKGDQLTALYESIDKALATGQSMDAWKREIAGVFAGNGWEPLSGFRLDNIFRTNIQTAFTTGRYAQLMEVAKSRPFWRYSAINDDRTRPTHSVLHGRVIRYDDPFWDTFYPPNGFRCRCTVTSLSKKQMEKKGLVAESIKPGQPLEPLDKSQMAVPVMPDKHFSTNAAKTYWQADTGRFRADVRQMVLKDLTRACPEDFSGPCEFAETDCFKTLSNYLSKTDQDDVKTVLWADGVRQKTEFPTWARGVLKNEKTDGAIYPMGNLPAKVLRGVASQPRLAMVAVDEAQVKALTTSFTDVLGTELTADAIEDLPARLAKGRWWIDTEESDVVTALVPQGEAWLKVGIRLDQEIEKGRVVNQLTSIEAVATDNPGGLDRYKEV